MENALSVSSSEVATTTTSSVPSPIKDKWQGAVTQGSGFVAVPMVLLRMQTKYGLSQTEMMVLINLLAHWWEPSRGVFPRSSIIAARLGVAKRTVQRATEKLEGMGLIERDTDDKGRRVFSFDGLVARLIRDVPAAFSVQAEENRGPKTR
jgi:hypothetical protein